MIRALLLGSIATLAFAFSASAQEGGCFKDTDCKGSRICVDRLCVDPPAVRSCGRDLDCPGDDICEQHICLPPANSKKKATKPKPPAKRDLIKEARENSAQSASPPPAPAPEADTAPPLVSLPPAASKPAPLPEPTQTPSNPPPSSTPPAAVASPPPPTPAPVETAPAPVATPPPAPTPDLIQAGPPTTNSPPPPPPDLISSVPPPPPLVAAPAIITSPPAEEPTRDGPGSLLVGGGLGLGFHTWSAGSSETDFGIDLNADIGIRFASNFGIEVIALGNYTAMLDSHTGLDAGIGLGMRLDHLGTLPGHFILGGAVSFGGISSSKASVATIDVTGGAIVLQYALPLVRTFEIQGNTGFHFLSASSGGSGSLTLFTFAVGIAFGN